MIVRRVALCTAYSRRSLSWKRRSHNVASDICSPLTILRSSRKLPAFTSETCAMRRSQPANPFMPAKQSALASFHSRETIRSSLPPFFDAQSCEESHFNEVTLADRSRPADSMLRLERSRRLRHRSDLLHTPYDVVHGFDTRRELHVADELAGSEILRCRNIGSDLVGATGKVSAFFRSRGSREFEISTNHEFERSGIPASLLGHSLQLVKHCSDGRERNSY